MLGMAPTKAVIFVVLSCNGMWRESSILHFLCSAPLPHKAPGTRKPEICFCKIHQEGLRDQGTGRKLPISHDESGTKWFIEDTFEKAMLV